MNIKKQCRRILATTVFGLCSVNVLAALSYSDINGMYQKSYAYETAGNYADAAKVLTPILNEFSNTYTINARLAYLSSMNLKTADAITFYEKASKAVPTAIDPKLGLMLIYLNQGKYDKAEKLGMEVTALDLSNYYGNLRLSVALRLQKKFTAAEKICIGMLTLYPADIGFLTEYGNVEFGLGQNDKAAAALYSVITLDPQNVTANAILGTIAEANKKKK